MLNNPFLMGGFPMGGNFQVPAQQADNRPPEEKYKE